MRLQGGNQSFADSAVVGGIGTLSQFNGITVMNNVTMNKAYALTANNTLSISSGKTLTVNGGLSINASGGFDTTVSGGGTLVIPTSVIATVTGNNNNDVYFSNVTVNNAGLFNLNQLNVNHVTALNNGAVFNNQAGGELRFTGADNQLLTTAGIGTFNNAGLVKSGGENINIGVNTANYNTGGTVDAATKTAFLYSTNNNYNGSVTFTGNSVVMPGGTHTVNGTITAGAGNTFSVTGGNVNLADGSILKLADNLNFTSGAINLTGTTTGSTIAAGSTLSLTSQTLGGPGLLTNLGTLNLSNAAINGSVKNQNVINATAGTSQLNGTTFDQIGGTLNLAAGVTLNKNTGGFNWIGGAISGSGTLGTTGGAAFAISGSGAHLLNGPALNLSSLSLSAGSLDLQTGTLNVGGATSIGAGATINLSGGTFTPGGALANAGTVNLNAGTLTVGGVLTNDGSFTVGGGANLVLQQNFDNAGTLAVNGTLAAGAGMTSFINSGLLKGSGTIDMSAPGIALVNNGTVAPGASPGTLTIIGDYVQNPGGSLAIELGGTLQGVNYDWLKVTGNAMIDGNLKVLITGGFTPTLVDNFQFITSTIAITGTFSSVTPPPGYGGGTIYGSNFAALGFTVLPSPVVETTGGLSPLINTTLDTLVTTLARTLPIEPVQRRPTEEETGDAPVMVCR